MTHSYKANIILALAAAVVLIALRILDAPVSAPPAPVSEIAEPLTGYAPAPTDQPAVLYYWEQVLDSLSQDTPVLISTVRLDRSMNWVNDEDMLWFLPRFGAPVVGYDTFACYRLYEHETHSEVQCGPMHSEDQYDGVAVFYMRVEDLARLFREYDTYAVVVQPNADFE